MAREENLSAKQTKELTEELAGLAELQSKALQTAAYLHMSEKEAQHYDKRAVRIGELCGLLGKRRPGGKKS